MDKPIDYTDKFNTICNQVEEYHDRDKEQNYWIFTFGTGQKYDGYYVKIYGNYIDARQKMFAKYGTNWSFQYSAEDWKSREERRPIYCPIEKELEVIG